MNQSKSLHNLLEVADLLAMIEELTDPGRVNESSPATWAGMRITLRSARERILESHADLSREVVQGARRKETTSSGQGKGNSSDASQRTKISTTTAELSSAAGATQQRDLKSALERFVDRN